MNHYQPFPRLFTIAEARGVLPTLRPMMKRIFECLDLLRSKSETVIRKDGIAPENPDLMKQLQKDESVRDAIVQLETLVEEINEMGCVCKGVEEGLIDFPCMLGGEAGFLCWRYDEDSISYWHGIQDGYSGRKPLLDMKGESGSSLH